MPKNRKKILVTGGVGAVGTYLVKELRSRGHEVFVADHKHTREMNYARCDVGEFRQVERLWTGGGWEQGSLSKPHKFDVVYHLAAEFGRWNGEDYYENVWRTNAVGTKNILRMQEREGFKAVYFSSSEVYGDYDGVMSEDVMDRVEIKQMNDYAMSKWVNEMQVLNSATQFGTKSVRVRLFNTYGPGEYYSPYRSVICLFCYRILHDIPIHGLQRLQAHQHLHHRHGAHACRTSPIASRPARSTTSAARTSTPSRSAPRSGAAPDRQAEAAQEAGQGDRR